MKKSRSDGRTAVFSKISNLTVVACCGAASTCLYRIFDESNNAVNPHAAQMRYSCINEIIPASAKPSDGPKASARLPDSPKYPIPSPRRLGGIKSVAMVPVAVLENPQPIPWLIRTNNKSTMIVLHQHQRTE